MCFGFREPLVAMVVVIVYFLVLSSVRSTATGIVGEGSMYVCMLVCEYVCMCVCGQ